MSANEGEDNVEGVESDVGSITDRSSADGSKNSRHSGSDNASKSSSERSDSSKAKVRTYHWSGKYMKIKIDGAMLNIHCHLITRASLTYLDECLSNQLGILHAAGLNSSAHHFIGSIKVKCKIWVFNKLLLSTPFKSSS